MKLSVVIPVYNEEAVLAACLKHVYKQTRPADEVIVVDNNCTDQSMAIVRQLYPMTKIVKEPQQGRTPARNKGFDTATGDLIVRTDADTHVPPSWLKRIENTYKKQPFDAITGPLEFYDLRSSEMQIAFKAYMKTMYRMLDFHLLHGPNLAITKQMWNSVKGEVCDDDRDVHEDYDLSIHVAGQGGRITYDPQLIVPVSSRRIKDDPLTFFVEYPLRVAKTFRKHYSLRDAVNKRLRQTLMK